MNSDQADPEREFILTGVKTYLDVWDTILEFRTRVQEDCNAAVGNRLHEINKAFKMNWTGSNLKDYLYHDSSHSEAQIGKKILIKDLGSTAGGLYFALVLSRANDSITAEMRAFIYRDNEKAASDFWNSLSVCRSEIAYSRGKLEWGVRRCLADGSPLDFREHLTQAIDSFTACVNAAGGLLRD